MFNFLGVVVWLPIDQIFNAVNSGNGGLFALTVSAIVPEDLAESEDDDLFIKKAVASISKKVISNQQGHYQGLCYGCSADFLCEQPWHNLPDEGKEGLLRQCHPDS